MKSQSEANVRFSLARGAPLADNGGSKECSRPRKLGEEQIRTVSCTQAGEKVVGKTVVRGSLHMLQLTFDCRSLKHSQQRPMKKPHTAH